jgi:hypothetical protein
MAIGGRIGVAWRGGLDDGEMGVLDGSVYCSWP